MQTITELTLNDSMFYRNIPVFTYHITYPSFSTTCVLAAAQAANTYYMQLAKTTEQYCRTVRQREKAGGGLRGKAGVRHHGQGGLLFY